MISIIITAYKESATIGKAIDSMLNQELKDNFEIMVVCPDKETSDVVKGYEKRFDNIIYLKDPGLGKPHALNLAFKESKGDILVLSDGDVFVGKGALKELLTAFENEKNARRSVWNRVTLNKITQKTDIKKLAINPIFLSYISFPNK